MMIRGFALGLALASVSGCILVDTDTRPVNYPVSRIAVGLGVQGNLPSGYVITANTGSYRITWAGFREFQGSVWITAGRPQFTAGCIDGSCSLSSEDRVYLNTDDPQRIDFDSFPASGKRSGFDLTYTGDLVFDMFVDGQRRPDKVIFPAADVGGSIASAPGMPFGLTM